MKAICNKCKYVFEIFEIPCMHNTGPSNFVKITCPACMASRTLPKTCPKCSSLDVKEVVDIKE